MEQILIRYGELTLKKKNRKQFVDRLVANIRYQLKEYDVKISYDRNRMKVTSIELKDLEKVYNQLGLIPGIHSYAKAKRIDKDLEVIKKAAADKFDKSRPKFRISVKRSDKAYPYMSKDVEIELGTHILEQNQDLPNLEVNLKNYEQDIKIEIHRETAYIVDEYQRGMGGLPIGSAGRAAVLLSGGIDSPVAAILAMKRGLRVNLIHFSTPPYTNEQSLEKIKQLTKQLQKFDDKIKLYDVNITDFQMDIMKSCNEKNGTILLRRMMMRMASKVMKSSDSEALVTGENLSQVASQILSSMAITDEVVKTLILRPVLTYDKFEIIELAKKYKTYEISILPFEDCCSLFVPKSPNLSPNIEEILRDEAKVEIDKYLTQTAYDVYAKEDLERKQIDKYLI